MPIQNPLSIPGGWKKDTPRETPAAEEPNPVESQTIPRTPAGVVSEAGDILDQAGRSIGKVAPSEDGRSLVGNTVTATGDVVNEAGDVLGRASIDSDQQQEYTTQPADDNESQKQGEGEGQGQKSGSGFFGSAKGVFNSVGSIRSGLSLGGKSQAASEKAPSEAPNADVDDAKSAAQDAASDAPVDAPADNISSAAPDTPVDGHDDLTSQDPVQLEDRDDNGEEKRDDDDRKDEEKKDGEDKKDDDDLQSKTDDAAETVKGEDLETAKSQSNLNVSQQDPDEKLQSNVDLPDQTDQAKQDVDADAAPDAVPDGQKPEGLDADAPTEAGSELPADNKDKLGDEVSEDKDKLGDEVSEDKDKVDTEVSEDKDKPDTEVPADAEAQEGQEVEDEGPKIDYSILKGAKVNKAGNIVDESGNVVGRIVEGEAKKLQGKKCDEEGNIWNDAGKIVGKGEPIPDNEREDRKDFAPFENFPDATVEADGKVVSEGRQVGTVVEGDPKRLKGSKVDEDGDILDRNGNTVGRAEAWDEPEPIPEEVVDRSVLAGKRVNKAGNVVDSAGTIFGKVIEGNVSAIVGRMCDKEGNIRSESGDIVGKAEVVPEGEREGSKEGPFAELSGLTVRKDGKVVTPSNEVVGRLIQGDAKALYGRSVDEDGDVTDKNGNVLGKAERWEEPEEEKKKNPLAGRKVNREGNVVDEDGNIVAKLVSGDLLTCSGKEIDDDGDVVNSKGNTVGHVALLEDIPPEAEPEPEESEEQKKEREQAEQDRKLAGQLGGVIEQSLEKMQPILKMITDKIDKAERTPKEELDEEELVNQVRPLLEEGGKILSETNGAIRGLDPDGRIQRQAKHKSGTKEASAEEHHLAEVLKELTGGVSQTIDNAKRKIEGMPHAKKELNPLWGLLMEPLGQILAAVGLLLNGVLGLVGRLLSGLGLGALVDNILGGLGLNKILGSLGLGSAYDALVGKDKKKK